MMKNKKMPKKQMKTYSIPWCLVEGGLQYLGSQEKSPKSNQQGGWNKRAEKKMGLNKNVLAGKNLES